MVHNENLLHYVWKYKLYVPDGLATTDGQPIEIIDTGTHNTDAGPDFFNAKIKIGDTVWAGNVEIHRSSDEWEKHKHHQDKAYNSVVLHLAENINREVYNQKGLKVPQCKLLVPENVRKNAAYLLNNIHSIPCEKQLPTVPKLLVSSYLNVLAIERLERKTKDVFGHLKRYNNSWDETFYVMLSRNFGFGLNSDEFERLALSLPYNYIQKHSDSLFQVEALLFGQAGMLEDDRSRDEYYLKLQQEYRFLKSKYSLKNLDGFLFKKLRTRPQAFPQIRIAQLAVLLQQSGRLFSSVLEKEDYNQIRLYFHVNPSEYWQTHYSFEKESPKASKYIGDSSLNTILINTVAPILFAYGKMHDMEKYCERAVHILESVKAERNSIVSDFKSAGVSPKNAFDTQALIQLRKEYCDKRKCLYCRIGHFLLSSADLSY